MNKSGTAAADALVKICSQLLEELEKELTIFWDDSSLSHNNNNNRVLKCADSLMGRLDLTLLLHTSYPILYDLCFPDERAQSAAAEILTLPCCILLSFSIRS